MTYIEIEKGKEAQRPIFNLPRNKESYCYCCNSFTVNVIKCLVTIRPTFLISNGLIPRHPPSPYLKPIKLPTKSNLNISFPPLSRYLSRTSVPSITLRFSPSPWSSIFSFLRRISTCSTEPNLIEIRCDNLGPARYGPCDVRT